MANDREIIQHIDQLVDEEHTLERAHGEGKSLSNDERARCRPWRCSWTSSGTSSGSAGHGAPPASTPTAPRRATRRRWSGTGSDRGTVARAPVRGVGRHPRHAPHGVADPRQGARRAVAQGTRVGPRPLYVSARGITTGPVPSPGGPVRGRGRPARPRGRRAHRRGDAERVSCAAGPSPSSGASSSTRCDGGHRHRALARAAGGARPHSVPRRHEASRLRRRGRERGSGVCSPSSSRCSRRTGPRTRGRCRGCSSSGGAPTSPSPASPVSRAAAGRCRPARPWGVRPRADERRVVAGQRVVPEAGVLRVRVSQARGHRDGRAGVPGAAWNADLGEFILDYDVVRAAPSPEAALREFLDAAYDACATRADWDPKLCL